MLPRWMSRTSRADLAWGLVAFVVLQLGLAIVVKHWLPEPRDPVYQAAAARLAERRAAMPDRPLLLALGSSRTLLALDAGQVTRADGGWLVFNCSDLGAGPMVEQVFLRRLLADGVRPDLVLIEMLPLQLATGVVLPLEETALDPQRLTWAEMRGLFGYYRFPVLPGLRWLKANSLTSPDRQREIHEALHIGAPAREGITWSTDDYGFWPSPEPRTAAQRIAGIQAMLERYRPRMATARMAHGPARALRDLVALCRREQLPFAIILMPECAELRKMHTPAFRADLESLLAELQGDGAFPLFDARAWVADDGFIDAHHVHLEGARVFSSRFAEEALPALKRHVAELNGTYAMSR
jgi:Protein of unknown function (DUF1574)